MKITIINGSPRNGNTYDAINAMRLYKSSDVAIEIINISNKKISQCKGCGFCHSSNCCIDEDDTNELLNSITCSDAIIFASPVYWCNITGQMKVLLDKFYSRIQTIKGKDIGIVLIGGEQPDNAQYDIIGQQFELIAEYLNWNIRFKKYYCAEEKGDLQQNTEAMDELKELLEIIIKE